MTTALIIGLFAGVLQASAYFLYTYLVLQEETVPNGMSWLMWAYGTSVFFFIEFDIQAPISVLILPGVCALCACIVSGYSFYKSSYIPPERSDYVALVVDVSLMTGYLTLLYSVGTGQIQTDLYISIGLIFLVLTSLSTFVTFYPILRTTYENPKCENPIPWFIWTVAYALLLCTVLIENMTWEYMIYPIINMILHGATGLLSCSNNPRIAAWKKI